MASSGWNIHIEWKSKKQYDDETDKSSSFTFCPEHSAFISNQELIDNPDIKIKDLLNPELLKVMELNEKGIEVLSREQLCKLLNDNH